MLLLDEILHFLFLENLLLFIKYLLMHWIFLLSITSLSHLSDTLKLA